MHVLGGYRQSIKMVSPQAIQSSTSTGAKPFTKQKSKSFEEKIDHYISGPASQVILEIKDESWHCFYLNLFPGFALCKYCRCLKTQFSAGFLGESL